MVILDLLFNKVMPASQILKVAISSLRINKTRSALTMLGVIIGVTSVILLVSLGAGLQKYVNDQFESLGANLFFVMPGQVDLKKLSSGPPNFSTSKLEISDADYLVQNSTYIKTAMPDTFTQAILKYRDNKDYEMVLGTTQEYPTLVNDPVENGEYFTAADVHSARKVAVLGSKVAENLFGNEDPVGKKISIDDFKVEVIGVLTSKGGGLGGSDVDTRVSIPITVAKIFFNQDKASEIIIQAKDSDSVDLAISETKMLLSNHLKPNEFTVMNSKDMISAISSILSMLTAALAGIAAISLLVGGIGIMNIMLVSVTERTKEIGLRKALGATPNVILVQFLTEAIILSVGGGLIGILIGGTGAFILSKVAVAEITPWSVVLAFGVSVIVGVVFGVMPARRAAKLSPIEALRYE